MNYKNVINVNEPKFFVVYWGNNLPNLKDGAYVKNDDEYESTGTHWIGLYVYVDNGTKAR